MRSDQQRYFGPTESTDPSNPKPNPRCDVRRLHFLSTALRIGCCSWSLSFFQFWSDKIDEQEERISLPYHRADNEAHEARISEPCDIKGRYYDREARHNRP